VATPLVAILKEREPHYRAIRTRIGNQEARRSGPGDVTPDEPVTASTSRSTGAAPELSGRAIPPRPRKKGKRR
ncbi:MAG: hypothetical protein OSA99_15685, partial [Acidimicrobiales bacterium]|nr:hypothetical protein [Acidimicrobiales bacterium]